ncbi:BLUF domain-containing protein [Enterobacter cloacae complex sp. ECC445]|uniref:BLUF domain-containing protein n=1 Tax=Enterobacter cloacae complex sp. ECC445 TaxID=2913213 RepID=UPI003FA424ED
MLTTLIYRSQLNLSLPPTELRELVERARIRNANLNITGVLLARGSDVLQILEGSEESVLTLFHKIRDDRRHSGVVELMRDYGPRRRFENVGMLLFDLQIQSPKEVLQSVLNYSKLDSYLTSDDRVDAPRDKCAHFREINGIAAAFHYLQKNYNPTASFFL